MIKTEIISESPNVVLHQVSGTINESEAIVGSEQAIGVVSEFTKVHEYFNLALDMRGYSVTNLKAHKAWSLGFKEHELLKKHVTKMAIVGDETPQLRAEQEYIESETVKFFADLQPALDWFDVV